MTRFFITLCSLFLFSIQAEELPISAPFIPEAHLAKQAIAEIEKEQKNSSDKEDLKTQITAQGQNTQVEDYSPSLTESLNDSNTLKKQIKRQLSADNPQTNLEENSSEKEVANFGNVSVSISERKKEEKLRKVNKNN